MMKSVEDVLSEIEVGSYDYGKAFEALLEADKKDRETLKEQLNQVDRLQQDLLHILEIDNIPGPKMMKVASQLKQVRIKRREIKNRIEEFDSVRPHLNSIKKDVTSATQKVQSAKQKLESSTYRLREYKGYEAADKNRIVKVGI